MRCGGQGQESGEAGVNNGFDFLLVALRAAHEQADGCLMVRVDDTQDHAGFASLLWPKRWRARWPIRTNHICASAYRARRRSEAATAFSSTSNAPVSISMATILP